MVAVDELERDQRIYSRRHRSADPVRKHSSDHFRRCQQLEDGDQEGWQGPQFYDSHAFGRREDADDQGDGLSFNTPAYKDTLSMKFDGKDYEEKGPNVAPGSTLSGKRVNAHTLEVTDKVKGEVMDHTKFEVSPDGKTLTLTVHGTGQANAQTVVYDKV